MKEQDKPIPGDYDLLKSWDPIAAPKKLDELEVLELNKCKSLVATVKPREMATVEIK